MPTLADWVSALGGPVVLLSLYLLGRWRIRTRPTEAAELPRKPKDEDDYRTERRRIHDEYYVKAMDQYAERLLWATGGAFVVSFGAVQFLAKDLARTAFSAAGFLIAGWLVLLLAAIIIVLHPYTVSRMAAYGKAALTSVHRGDEHKAREDKRTSEAWGQLTKNLNEWAYVCLVLGLWYLVMFFARNVP